MVAMNIPRILGDVSHATSKCILIWAIHSNKSAEGVSLITQILYALVFINRYLNLFWDPPWYSWWNFMFKIFYISSSLYIIALMMQVYARTREREKAWRLGSYCLGGSVVAAPIVAVAFKKWEGWSFVQVLWTFSIVLESVCVLPQLLLLRQTTVPTVIDSFYLLTLGSYRAFYILNWILRLVQEHHFGPTEVIFGIVQTAFYVDFAWVYWTRQRVKLRNGGIVDSEDLSRGWLVSRIIGRERASLDEEERPVGDASNVAAKRHVRKESRWGPRGVSVSADENLDDHSTPLNEEAHLGVAKARDSLPEDTNPFEDGDSDDTTNLPQEGMKDSLNGVADASVWQNGRST